MNSTCTEFVLDVDIIYEFYKGGYSVHTTIIKHDSCNSYIANIMIVFKEIHQTEDMLTAIVFMALVFIKYI